jgi:catechol 2,3-dioxygenase-like lactoylglutathione lyase family enzyme
MEQLKKLVGFVMTQKPGEAIAFYRDKLGFKWLKDDGFALVFDANGNMLRVGKWQGESFTPAAHTVLGWAAEDIVATVSGLAQRGVKFERFDGLPQDELGIWTAPTGDRVAWFKDPDGNVLSVSQHT